MAVCGPRGSRARRPARRGRGQQVRGRRSGCDRPRSTGARGVRRSQGVRGSRLAVRTAAGARACGRSGPDRGPRAVGAPGGPRGRGRHPEASTPEARGAVDRAPARRRRHRGRPGSGCRLGRTGGPPATRRAPAGRTTPTRRAPAGHRRAGHRRPGHRRPDTAKPSTAKAVTAEPDRQGGHRRTGQPRSSRSPPNRTRRAVTAEPDTAKPDTSEWDTAEPVTAEPDTAKAVTAEPDTAKLGRLRVGHRQAGHLRVGHRRTGHLRVGRRAVGRVPRERVAAGRGGAARPDVGRPAAQRRRPARRAHRQPAPRRRTPGHRAPAHPAVARPAPGPRAGRELDGPARHVPARLGVGLAGPEARPAHGGKPTAEPQPWVSRPAAAAGRHAAPEPRAMPCPEPFTAPEGLRGTAPPPDGRPAAGGPEPLRPVEPPATDRPSPGRSTPLHRAAPPARLTRREPPCEQAVHVTLSAASITARSLCRSAASRPVPGGQSGASRRVTLDVSPATT